MKKILFSLSLLSIGIVAFAQNKSLQIYHNGNITNVISVSQIDSIKFGELLPTPTDVAANLDGNTIRVSWNTVSDATSYEVYRSSDNINYTTLQEDITTISFTDNTPLNGTNYYKVKAVNAVASSLLSDASPAVSFSGNNNNLTDPGIIINGVKWATRNVDAPGTFATSFTDLGMFYQWNRSIGWSNTDPMVNSNGGTTWDASNPTGTTWEKLNDPSPAGWHVPTDAECQSLLNTDKVSNIWTTENGVTGRKFTDKATGNTLFLPAASHRIKEDGRLVLDSIGSYGYYWSSAQYFNDAYCLFFYNNGNADWGISYRCHGFSVRSVAE